MVYFSRSLVRPFQRPSGCISRRPPMPHPQPLRNPRPGHRGFCAQAHRHSHFPGIPFAPPPQFRFRPTRLRSIVPILFFSQTFPCHLKDFCSHTSSAAFVPHPSFVSSLIEIVASRSGSKHFRRVTHGRDSIENGQSLFPPTLPANLFEKESSEERARLRHFPDCGHARLQGETIRGQKSGGGHLSSQHNWMAR